MVGTIPKGLPDVVLPGIDGHVALTLMPSAAIIALLGFMEAISIAKAMAAKTGQRIDPNQELIGQGLANLVGARDIILSSRNVYGGTYQLLHDWYGKRSNLDTVIAWFDGFDGALGQAQGETAQDGDGLDPPPGVLLP